MEQLEGLELISKKEKDIIDNFDQIINYCESYKEKARDLRINLQQIRNASEFRKRYYKTRKLISNLCSYTTEFMLELELTNPLENEEDCEIIEVPCLPSIDGESQKQQFEMMFLHGSSPWNFWLSHCAENITRRLKELLQKREKIVQDLVERPICGDYVLYKQGARLRRAMVLKTLSSERYQILDIDNGTTSLIRLKRLFKMDEEISLIPYQAVNCSLMKDSEDSSLWNKELEEIFSSTLKRCKLTVKIIEENPGYPTCFLVKLKAEDIDDDTELTVDVGKWITKRIIPELKSGSSLSVSVLDAFFNEEDDDDSSDASNNKSGDLSQSNQKSPIVELPNDVKEEVDSSKESQSGQKSPIVELPNDVKEEVDSSEESRILEYGTDQKISLEIVPVLTLPATATNAQAYNYGKDVATNMINAPTFKKIAANFNECPRRNYPDSSQTTGMVTVYPMLPIPQTAGSMTGYPVMPRHPNAGTMMGYHPIMQRPPSAGSIGGYPINLGTSQTGSIRYPMEPRPQSTNIITPPSPWSTNDYNTVVNQNYEMPKYDLKTPVVLVRPNEELRAICSYVVSPNEFYVHLVNKNNLKIDSLLADLERFYSKCNSPNYRLRPGFKYCACKYIFDENYPCAPLSTWFRAEVISMEGNEAFVFLVDYGVKVWRNINELRVLDQRFFVYDKMAQRCHLHEVPMMENANYSEDVSEYLKSLLVTKDGLQQLNINVFNNVQTRVSSLSVVIKLPERDETINDEIIRFIKSKEANPCEEYEWDPMSEDYYAETNRLDHVIDNPLMATGGYIPKDEERVCRFYAKTGRCPKKACRQEHVFIGEDVFTVDRAETFGHTFTQQQLPEEGSKLKVKFLANACITPTRFYGHWLYANVTEKIRNNYGKYKYDNDDDDDDDDDYNDGEDYDYDDEDKETLITLMDALNEPRNTQKYKFIHLPEIGEMVIVRVIEDEEDNVIWYRGQVAEVQEKFCAVFLIDFGVTRKISVHHMRAMEPRFLHLPAQATEFCVAGVQIVEDEWGPNELPTSILSQWEDTVLSAYVIKRNHGSVEVNLRDANGESVRSKLVETGKYRPFDKQFGEDSSVIPG